MRGSSAGTGRGARLAAALAVALGVLVACAGDAVAETGLRLGAYAGTDADDPVPVIGAYARLDVPGPLNLEVSADYRRESLRGGDLEATVVPVRASAVLNLLPGVSPYLLAGVGADYVRVDFRHELAGWGEESALVYEAHAGAGLEVGLGPFSIVGDLRYCAVGEVTNAAVRAGLGHAYDASGWYASLSAGLSF
ncbi:MAG TPA: hypothetical protein VN317_10415 [Candidatus Methanoperedens sp.]|nr:hypothetical protein [Candidatus Methanoperedens sp.]